MAKGGDPNPKELGEGLWLILADFPGGGSNFSWRNAKNRFKV